MIKSCENCKYLKMAVTFLCCDDRRICTAYPLGDDMRELDRKDHPYREDATRCRLYLEKQSNSEVEE